MSRTLVSGATGRVLSFPSGNWECPILGRVAYLMGTEHYHREITRARMLHRLGVGNMPKWIGYTQPYNLDGAACREFASALLSVTDAVVEEIHPYCSQLFNGTPNELKCAIQWYGGKYFRLKKGYRCVG